MKKAQRSSIQAYKFFLPKDQLKSLQQVKIFIQKKLLSTAKIWKKEYPSFYLNFEFLEPDIEQES